ncbi:MAG: hypothetical protein HC767_10590 [Akkermansiaceae bacterium]|nr:hypothetical protein [Akkermansiaceae bacterium]
MQIDAEEHVRAFYKEGDPSTRERQFANHVFTIPSDSHRELPPFDRESGDGDGDGGRGLVDTLPHKARLQRLANGSRHQVLCWVC